MDWGWVREVMFHLAWIEHPAVRKINNKIGEGLCKQNLGSLAIQMNDLDAAEKLLNESKKILEQQNSEHLFATLKELERIRELRRK